MVIRTNPLPRLLPNVPVVYASPVGNDLPVLYWEIYLRQFVDGRLITGEGAQDSPAKDDNEPHGDALPTLLEVLEQEAEDRRQRRIVRLLRESRLPLGKTCETFEHHRMPLVLRQQLDHLAQGSFVEHGVNALAFGLPGTGKAHALCALGHRLVEAGHSVLFAPVYRLVQELLASTLRKIQEK